MLSCFSIISYISFQNYNMCQNLFHQLPSEKETTYWIRPMFMVQHVEERWKISLDFIALQVWSSQMIQSWKEDQRSEHKKMVHWSKFFLKLKCVKHHDRPKMFFNHFQYLLLLNRFKIFILWQNCGTWIAAAFSLSHFR